MVKVNFGQKQMEKNISVKKKDLVKKNLSKKNFRDFSLNFCCQKNVGQKNLVKKMLVQVKFLSQVWLQYDFIAISAKLDLDLG